MGVDFDAVGTACRNAFGESVTYTPQGGSAVSLSGIFNAQTEVIEDGAGGIPVRSTLPSLGFKTSAIAPSVAKAGDTVTVRSTSYKVRAVEDDGEGMVRVLLHRSS